MKMDPFLNSLIDYILCNLKCLVIFFLLPIHCLKTLLNLQLDSDSSLCEISKNVLIASPSTNHNQNFNRKFHVSTFFKDVKSINMTTCIQ